MRRFCWLLSQDYLWDETFKFRCLIEHFCNSINYCLSCFKMKCDTPFERYSDLWDLFNEIFKTGNWGVTVSMGFLPQRGLKFWKTPLEIPSVVSKPLVLIKSLYSNRLAYNDVFVLACVWIWFGEMHVLFCEPSL